jgi:uncharacterized delta-60 repeat protein
MVFLKSLTALNNAFMSSKRFKFLPSAFFCSILLLVFNQWAFAIQAGRFDSTFGVGGKVADLPFSFRANDVTAQTDGKIVAVGTDEESGDFVIIRLNTDGSLDQSFGDSGRVTTDFLEGEDIARAVVIQSDGKIVVAGTAKRPIGARPNFALARYETGGAPDTSFSGDGKVLVEFGTSEAFALAVQPDGKLVIAGYDFSFTSGAQSNFALARTNGDGTLDTTFDGDGKVSTDFLTGNDIASDVALQPDGKIVVAGTKDIGEASTQDFALARYNADGSLDTSFGNGGKVTTDFFTNLDDAKAVAIQPDGKIVVGGSAVTAANTSFALARYQSNGDLDESFDGDGKVITDFGGSSNSISDIVIQSSSGKIIAAGSALVKSGGVFALARYKRDGSLDPTFDFDGRKTTGFENSAGGSAATAAALETDGRLIVAGTISPTASAFVRYLLGTAIADFDGDGTTDLSFFRRSEGAWHLRRSTSGLTEITLGSDESEIVPADYDGDGRTDAAVFSDGSWQIQRSALGPAAVNFGAAGDIPVPADYEGDGRADIAVFRQGVWFFLDSSTNQFRAVQFGISGDKPVPADFDGDGRADVAVYRDGVWYWLESSTGAFRAVQFGIATDIAVVGDYDGDGKADPAVFRDGIWYILQSQLGFTGIQFGIATDIPVPADYDGDDITDIAVFRNGIWYLLKSMAGFDGIVFGTADDEPVPAAFVPLD